MHCEYENIEHQRREYYHRHKKQRELRSGSRGINEEQLPGLFPDRTGVTTYTISPLLVSPEGTIGLF